MSLAFPRHPYFFMYVPMYVHRVRFVRGKRNESSIYLRAPSRALFALVLVKAPIGSRVQLYDMRTKSSIPLSKKVYKDSKRTRRDGLERGQGTATFQICCGKVFDFSRRLSAKGALSVSRQRRDGEI